MVPSGGACARCRARNARAVGSIGLALRHAVCSLEMKNAKPAEGFRRLRGTVWGPVTFSPGVEQRIRRLFCVWVSAAETAPAVALAARNARCSWPTHSGSFVWFWSIHVS